jgi:Arc/MetJ-type ribon-helix-helix transcriptional regulator
MPIQPSPISVRLPLKLRAEIDKAVKSTKLSRSEIMKEALERHLPDIANKGARKVTAGRYARLIAMAGAGAPHSAYKSDEDVIATIREFRGED